MNKMKTAENIQIDKGVYWVFVLSEQKDGVIIKGKSSEWKMQNMNFLDSET